MNFQGIFFSIISFSIVVVCQPVLVRAEFHFSSRIWPVFFVLGVLLLLISFFICYLWLSILFCTAALTFIHGALKLKERLPGHSGRRRSRCRPSHTKGCRR